MTAPPTAQPAPPPRLPEALDGRDDRPVRHAGHASSPCRSIAATVLSGRRRSRSRCSATIEFLPFILFSLPAGVWVDRLRRRPILIIGDLGRAIALASIPIAFDFGALTIWQLYIVGFVNGCLTVFFDVAYQSYLPSLVERDQLVEGNSKLEISRSAAQILGPGIAGVPDRGRDGAVRDRRSTRSSYLVSAFFVFLIRRPEPPPGPAHAAADGAEPSMRQEIAAACGTSWATPGCARSPPPPATSNLFGNIDVRDLHPLRRAATGPRRPGRSGSSFSIGDDRRRSSAR